MSSSISEEELEHQYNIEGVQGCLEFSIGYVLDGLEYPQYWEEGRSDEMLVMLLKLNRKSSKFLRNKMAST